MTKTKYNLFTVYPKNPKKFIELVDIPIIYNIDYNKYFKFYKPFDLNTPITIDPHKIFLEKERHKQNNRKLNKQKYGDIKKNNEKIRKDFKKAILKNTDNIWIPPLDIKMVTQDTDSWYSMTKYVDKVNHPFPTIYFDENNKEEDDEDDEEDEEDEEDDEKIMKANKIIMHLRYEQTLIFQRWMKSYILMYNKTIEFIRSNYQKSIKITYNWKKLRTLYLKKVKDEIIETSGISEDILAKYSDFFLSDKSKKQLKKQLNKKQNKEHKEQKEKKIIKPIYKNTQIRAHMLDCAIKLACANYKSALTNFKRGNISHFRIRYWRMNKDKKKIDIEKNFIQQIKETKKWSICSSLLGEIKCTKDGKEFNMEDIITKYKSDINVQYDGKTKIYTLYAPEEIEKEEIIKERRKTIALDPGMRTFMTGLSEDEAIKIGTNVIEVIKNNLLKIDKYNNNKEIPKRLKKKVEKRTYKRIENLVNDLHWKSIKYLTENYETVLIGDMSAKSIVNKENSKLNSMMKRIAMILRYYVYRERLEYKCKIRTVNYKKINEKYTSQMCSNCGNRDKKLEGNKEYNCKKCKKRMDRDLHSCRGFVTKGTYQ